MTNIYIFIWLYVWQILFSWKTADAASLLDDGSGLETGEIWLRWYQMKEIGAYCETSLILISIKLSNWIYFWTDEAEGLKYLIFVTLQVGWMLTPISLHSLVLQ